MNPRAEATERLAGRYDARVLEPSPPAVTSGPWFADDPVDPLSAPTGRPVVSPVATAELTWEQLTADDPGLAAWCAERWLAALPTLAPVPSRLVETRGALHRLAEQVISPARRRANTKIGLRWTRGGFGTPWFAPERQLRVDGDVLVVTDGEQEYREPIRSLNAAAERLGPGWLPGDVALDDAPLAVDAAAAAFIGDWFGFATHVLETLRATAEGTADPSRVQLWPEHFDLALELGAESSRARAAYGLSPGDEAHDEPYLYVAPWQAPEPGPLWRAATFAGAELSYASLLAAPDQRSAALSFFSARLDALTRELNASRSPEQERAHFRAGMRDGVPYALAGMLVAVSYGVLAKPVLGSAAPIVMSAVVFAGSAQFASLAVLAAGGGAVTAIVAGLLLNLRFLPMGIAIAPSMVNGALGRAVRGQALVDASWALANRGGGRFDVSALLGATTVQYVTWNVGTVLGVLAGGALGDPSRIGLDAVYPAFFLGLLVTELRRPGARLISLAGAAIALALTPVLPAGVPILAAAAAAALGLRR